MKSVVLLIAISLVLVAAQDERHHQHHHDNDNHIHLPGNDRLKKSLAHLNMQMTEKSEKNPKNLRIYFRI